MNTLTVTNTLNSIFKLDNDFQVVFNDGHGDSSDEIKVKYVGHVYAKGYSFTLNVNYCSNSGKWVADVNGFNELKNISNEIELKFAVEYLTKFSKAPCAEQELCEMESNSEIGSNPSFY